MLSLYEITVINFSRNLEACIDVMTKGEAFLTAQNIDLNAIVNLRLADDMLPFSAQVNIAAHNAAGGVQAMLDGEFTPPQVSLDGLDYQGLIAHFKSALATLNTFSAEEVNGCFGKPLYFKAGGNTVPFTSENFIMSFAAPNVYFHTTTIYDMLRMQGVPLGKKDYLGNMKIGIAE
ncbi:DUF1993 domain-containing protein [Alteromonas sp. C1M14]|uniref:DUF1993 domain-containing protein n=1 Tax=Alteromonas sp. C1M14 TaxID=2841567 RepID=UPI001C083BCB|nr:DUF1993 domain-containing protein [Alteromonas sp. C1M14]MBU2976933.1 DUF1993 domain-containing protein [Alteromonas sp. C1M14]